MATQQGMEIPIATLLRNAKVYKVTRARQYERDLAAYERGVVAAHAKFKREVAKAAAKVQRERKRAPDRYHNQLSMQVSVNLPTPKPHKPDLTNVDRDIRFLEASAKTTMNVRIDSHWAKYVGA